MRADDLPEPMSKAQCVLIDSGLFVLNSTNDHCSVYFSKPLVVY